MNVAELKIEIHRRVDALDATKLEEFYGVMLNYFNSKNDAGDWIGVSQEEQKGIQAAIDELDAGKGIPHAEVMRSFRKKYAHG